MSDTPVNPSVLIADDDEISRLFLVESLEQAGFRIIAVADGTAALEALRQQAFDLLLLDVDMPRQNGYQVCRSVRSTGEGNQLPIVMITGHDDADSIARAYDAGATDFIAKPVNWTLLPHRLRYILRNAEADRRVRHLAYYDSLTGLPNTQALTSLVTTALSRVGDLDHSGSVALLYIGVPGCTRIRSVFGHDEGDQALRAFSQRLIECLSAVGEETGRIATARIDGDRFILCLEAHDIRTSALSLSEYVTAALDEPVQCGEHQFLSATDHRDCVLTRSRTRRPDPD